MNFKEDTYSVFSSPVTEVTTWGLQENADAGELVSRLHSFVQLLHTQGIQHGTYGRAVEDERLFAVVLGWNSKEVGHE